MKIRIKGNSIRLRLSKTDVATLGHEGIVVEKTEFGNATFTYQLRSKPNNIYMEASFDHNTISIDMPQSFVEEFVQTDRISFEHLAYTSAGELFLLVEKDFQCLDHSREDQSDMYINPNKHC